MKPLVYSDPENYSIRRLQTPMPILRTIAMLAVLSAGFFAGHLPSSASESNADARVAATSGSSLYALRVLVIFDRSDIDNAFNGEEKLESLLGDAIKSIHEMVERHGSLRDMRLTLPLIDESSGYRFGEGHMFGRSDKPKAEAAVETSQRESDSSMKVSEAGIARSMSLSPLIIDVSMGDCKINDSFNGPGDGPDGGPGGGSERERQSGFLKTLTGGGVYKELQCPRPFRLTVGFQHASVNDSLDYKGEVPETVQRYGQLQSRDFVWTDASRSKRALRLSVMIKGSKISHSFNKTAGIVKVANELADALEKNLTPDELCHIDWISIYNGPVHFQDARDEIL